MRSMIVGLVLAMSAGVAMADYETAIFTGQREPVGGSHTRCFYQSQYGIAFSIVIKNGMCPYQVRVDPESGQVEK